MGQAKWKRDHPDEAAKSRWDKAQPHLQQMFKEAQLARGYPLVANDQRGIFDLKLVEMQHVPLVYLAATILRDVEAIRLMQAIDQAAYEVEQGRGLCLLCPAKFSNPFEVSRFIVLTAAYTPGVYRTGIVHYLCKNQW